MNSRQREILQLLSIGKSKKEIAEQIQKSEPVTYTEIAKLRAHFRAKTNEQMMVEACKENLL